MIALTITGHTSLSDWSFLVALVALALAAVAVGTRWVDRPSGGHVAGNRAALVRALALFGAALVALGLLVL